MHIKILSQIQTIRAWVPISTSLQAQTSVKLVEYGWNINDSDGSRKWKAIERMLKEKDWRNRIDKTNAVTQLENSSPNKPKE